MNVSIRLSLAASLVWFGCGGSDGRDADDGGRDNVDCTAVIDHEYDCGVLPEEGREQLYEVNVQICENWDRTYKPAVMQKFDSCADVECSALPMCLADVTVLCQADVSAEIDELCVKIVECGWDNVTSMDQCRQVLAGNTMLYMCLDPSYLDLYIDCVTGTECGPDSRTEFYSCYTDLLAPQ